MGEVVSNIPHHRANNRIETLIISVRALPRLFAQQKSSTIRKTHALHQVGERENKYNLIGLLLYLMGFICIIQHR